MQISGGEVVEFAVRFNESSQMKYCLTVFANDFAKIGLKESDDQGSVSQPDFDLGGIL